ncbi:MAG: D-glycerate dehydrogenase [Candidatus Hydrothermae bacterium]|nr:D-glycerate dehydrogenase [Candidatus Hydrothermae bacterium]
MVIDLTRVFPDMERFETLRAYGATLRVEPEDRPLPRARLLEQIRDVDILVCTLAERVDEALLARAPTLKLVSTYSVGYDHLDLTALRARGVWATHTPDVLTDATADLAWALLLAAARWVVPADRFVRAGRFQGWEATGFLGMELKGKTLGIVGAGRIGQAVARRAPGFGMQVVYTSRRRKPELEERLGARFLDLDALLREADVVSLHVPLTPETHHLLNRSRLMKMKAGAILINTARGPVVDERALVEVLRSGHLFAAGLDVYEREPEVEAALMQMENVVLLPHLGSATRDTRGRMTAAVVESVRSFLEGERPPRHTIPEMRP